jgi:WD domain, G-beta repeat
MAILTTIALIQRQTAIHQRNLALSREVADLATKTGRSDIALAMQLGLAAYRIAPTTEALSSLVSNSTLHTATRKLVGTDNLLAVAFSPDRHTLAVGSADQAIHLYDITNPQAPTFLSILTDHTGTVFAVAFSPDGHTLASVSNDDTIRTWETRPEQAAKDICPLIVTPITPAQWQRYIPDLPYDPPCK